MFPSILHHASPRALSSTLRLLRIHVLPALAALPQSNGRAISRGPYWSMRLPRRGPTVDATVTCELLDTKIVTATIVRVGEARHVLCGLARDAPDVAHYRRRERAHRDWGHRRTRASRQTPEFRSATTRRRLIVKSIVGPELRSFVKRLLADVDSFARSRRVIRSPPTF